ncbi:MAG: hypothetical protein KKD75_04025 [Nanoarchaeota archaeon]|nr:hypothetical protein [Nanoarchaeota archaeon]MBU1632353.1 hypothetical protein [Nanoarchaeota archaeon]MBU1876005.1 hypothetical protein [Nanoarchaeota archaeon]
MSEDYRSELLKEFGFEEEVGEIIIKGFEKTGFPVPIRVHRLSWEVYDLSLEEPYFWMLDYFKENFHFIEKIEDTFAAAENSAFFGVTQQRLGAQQDKVSQFLAAMGKMIKELFQMVRELRIIDERLTYYDEAEKQLDKPVYQRSKSSEITLKGLFVDLVQGGGKSAASVYGMARELEFITLPDLFFDAPPFKNEHELDEHIKALSENFNRNVIRVLQRHLRQFMEWKRRTHQEHKNRRRFQLQYLWQHFEIIKMYLNWIKPYLRHVARLTMKEKSISSADIVSAFEGSMLDIEFLAYKKKDDAYGCVLVTFNYRTRPEMKVVQDGYQRGPVHIGKMVVHTRAYAWTKKQFDNYKKLKEKETLLLMGEVSASVQKAMEALGEELDNYLAEARGDMEHKGSKKEEKTVQKSFMEKFFGDFYTPKKKGFDSGKSAKELKQEAAARNKAIEEFKGHVNFHTWNALHIFKKAHRMIAW